MNCTYEFVTAWQTSSTVQEVGQKTGLKYSSIATIASKLRKMGVPLKLMSTRYKNIDVPGLKKIAESFNTNGDNKT
jgi:hypothetical protein